MTYVRPIEDDEGDRSAPMPGWIASRRGESAEDAAFLSGAALAYLHLVAAQDTMPHALWRDRLSLSAAEACVRLAGRTERAGDLRDEVHLLRPGDLPGPAGGIFMAWRLAVQRPVSAAALHRALPGLSQARIAAWLDAGQGGPVARAAAVLEAVRAEMPRDETAALTLADAALARALRWEHAVPLLATQLTSRDLRKSGDDLRLACHRAVLAAVPEAARVATDLARRAARLRSVTPRLRAKGAGAAVEIFLSHDAVAPSALTRIMSDRAARRLCDRLVHLGAVRELTGRDTFRLYGV